MADGEEVTVEVESGGGEVTVEVADGEEEDPRTGRRIAKPTGKERVRRRRADGASRKMVVSGE